MDLNLMDLITFLWTMFQIYERFFKGKVTKKNRKTKKHSKKRK